MVGKKIPALGNVPPMELSPVQTGDAKADAAIRKLQAWPMNPHTPAKRPTGKAYDRAVRAAEKVGVAALVELLDERAMDTGTSRWSEPQVKKLGTAERKAFKALYAEVLGAVAVRKAYLHWLVGAVCNASSGFERALRVVTEGSVDARLVAADALAQHLRSSQAKRRVVEALDVGAWDGKDEDLARVYRTAVTMLGDVDPKAAYDRWHGVLRPAQAKRKPGQRRAKAVLAGIAASAKPDPRWTKAAVPHVRGPLAQAAMDLLAALPPDPATRDALKRALPKPKSKGAHWDQKALGLLARVADPDCVPWFSAALHDSWMNWPVAFEGFRVAGDPQAVNVIRDWLKNNGAPDRRKAAKKVIAELERGGEVARRRATAKADATAPTTARPTLRYVKARAFRTPKLESRAKLDTLFRKAFVAADLDDAFDRIVEPAVLLLPKRVNEARLRPGGTKLGGHPDLPKGTPWPRVRRAPLTFVAQFALDEFAPHLRQGALPSSGLLSVFVGEDPEGKVGYLERARVLFTRRGSKLVRHEVPEDYTGRIYHAATTRLHPTLSLPHPTNKRLTKILRGNRRERYAAVAFHEAPALPQVLGYRTAGYDAFEAATMAMLLQLPGDNQTEMRFGDREILSFYINEKKLAAADFSRVEPRFIE